MEERTKRVVPPALKQMLIKDEALTVQFCKAGDKVLPPEKYRKHFKSLEISCHALPWVSLNLALLWLLWNPALFQFQVNLLIGLIFDLLCISVVKAAVRRRRPSGNVSDMFLTMGPDQYSFPSGHVTRAFFLGYFFTYLYPLNVVMRFLIYVWMVAIAISRVLLRRHHILDVIGGAVLGFAEGIVIGFLWLSESSSLSLVTFLSEEGTTLEGLHDGFDVDVVNDDL